MSGLVSREEKIAILRREFDEVDVDHNDYLTIDELNSHLDRKVRDKVQIIMHEK